MTDLTLREKIEALTEFTFGGYPAVYLSKHELLALLDAHQQTDQPAPDLAAYAITCAAEILAMRALDTGRQVDRWFVPQVTWVKDFPGQITNGRIGRPKIALAPVSWLPRVLGDAVMQLIHEGTRS